MMIFFRFNVIKFFSDNLIYWKEKLSWYNMYRPVEDVYYSNTKHSSNVSIFPVVFCAHFAPQCQTAAPRETTGDCRDHCKEKKKHSKKTAPSIRISSILQWHDLNHNQHQMSVEAWKYLDVSTLSADKINLRVHLKKQSMPCVECDMNK